ncbi:acVLRF1 family peptidyl-tRNA hydrolase [Nocardioides sp. SOB77]|uniref:AcVLRF1 family peptidyl-tRNA hydrolase n=1 Tax=Nocardioides oceani TaxID=3058369 RepID=A0ABT8FJC6_9ACTN|nr:acVLRF1 family peptidyl-tRNA hydrolase [Nocardioides oceani]MDN4174778.1 acVLRF1 family peptidyl-tRNA hydrolase [Nocardioides oceani]
MTAGGGPVLVPAERWARWVLNFQGRHGATALAVVDGGLAGTAADGSDFTARLPFEQAYAGLPDAEAFAGASIPPADWGVLLVRKGGFAVARVSGTSVVDSKVGQRHVQGRTKAGGQSQQRFARRRDNQARAAYEAAAGHAARVLHGLGGPLVTGGDRPAVEEVLAGPPLDRLTVVGPWLAVPDPRRAVLDQAVLDACAVQVRVHNAS